MVVLEDLHWAEDSVFAFVRYILEWATDLSLFLVATARPELLTDHPEWGGGIRNAATIGLEPLSTEETSTLVSSLWSEPVMSADIQAKLMERSGGNPLYVTEFVRLAADTGVSVDVDAVDLLPDSIHSITTRRRSASASGRQITSTRPPGTASAPYLAALVASSCTIIPTATARSGSSRTGSPAMTFAGSRA